MQSRGSNNYRILILEDEFIISDTITRHLERRGHLVVGSAMSYEEGVEIIKRESVDLAILDIHVEGQRTGIDFAEYLSRLPEPVPFVFLTSQIDSGSIERARRTFPGGYLSKPVQAGSLLATVEVALHNSRARRREQSPTVTLRDGKETFRIDVADILYLQSSHVYVDVHLKNKPPLMLRSTLSELVQQVGEDRLLRVHRSYAVNPLHITRFDREQVWIGENCVPVSRARRPAVSQRLDPDSQHQPADRST